jgi:Cu-processing system permease protein
MISLRGVTKRYGVRPVLQDVSCDIQPGEITLLLGANGAGKSTLLRCLLGLVDYSGDITLDGLSPLVHGRGLRARIGYMPQHGGLHPDLTVSETMKFFADIRRADHARIMPLLEEAGLGPESDTKVGDLSGGMRQRLGFAVALVSDPPILILDEPTASLDKAGRQWIAQRLHALAASGRTVLVSTHAGHQLIEGGARVMTIEEGRLIFADSTSRVHPDTVPVPRLAGLETAKPGNPAPIALKEIRDALKNRWLLAFAALLGVLGLAATASGYDGVAGLSLQAFGRTTATMLNLSLLLAPLVGVLIGAASIAGERERGTLELLLAQPVSRTELLLAKHAGLLVAIAASTIAGFVPAGLMVAAVSGGSSLLFFALFPLLAVAAASALAGAGLMISVTSRSAVQAQGAAVAVWFAMALLYDLVLIGALAAGGLAPHWLVPALAANPIDATRVLGVMALDPELYSLGPAGVYLATTLGPRAAAAGLSAVLLCWAALPVWMAAIRFSSPLRRKHRHEPDTNHSVARSVWTGLRHRVRVGRA